MASGREQIARDGNLGEIGLDEGIHDLDCDDGNQGDDPVIHEVLFHRLSGVEPERIFTAVELRDVRGYRRAAGVRVPLAPVTHCEPNAGTLPENRISSPGHGGTGFHVQPPRITRANADGEREKSVFCGQPGNVPKRP